MQSTPSLFPGADSDPGERQSRLSFLMYHSQVGVQRVVVFGKGGWVDYKLKYNWYDISHYTPKIHYITRWLAFFMRAGGGYNPSEIAEKSTLK